MESRLSSLIAASEKGDRSATGTNVILQFSTETRVSTGGRLNLRYSIDGGPSTIVGPEFFSSDPSFQTRTAIGVFQVGAGTHTIRPMLNQEGGTTRQIFFRCFTAE